MLLHSSTVFYRDKAHEWRWRTRHVNGNIIADSSEGYKNKQGAWDGFWSSQNRPGPDLKTRFPSTSGSSDAFTYYHYKPNLGDSE